MSQSTTSRERANAIRALAMDAVQLANSGHPGMPLGMADIAEVLWHDFLRHNPQNPHWPNRDRFILSNGHGAMLQYALLHLSGYDISIDDIKQFRQLYSKTPGHPEHADTPGIETSTGPLGQGLANAVGMALAEAKMMQTFNRDGFPLVDHFTYVFLGDGCLMEGISHEACSLAGTLKLGKLIGFWDDNDISIDGQVNGWFTDDTPARFKAYGWHVVSGVNGHDAKAIASAIKTAQKVTDKPSLICCKTTIGFGSPNKAGTAGCHGAPLGEEEIQATRKALNWTYPAFEIPEAIAKDWNACEQGKGLESAWQAMFDQYTKVHPKLAAEWRRRQQGLLPDNWDQLCLNYVASCQQESKDMATRKASLQWLNHMAEHLPELIGGSADLSGSNLTLHQHSLALSAPEYQGNYVHYGVREFAMAAIMNGMALYNGFIPYGGTFLVFQDYLRNAMRLSALMQQKVIYVLTHDSIGLGEDGPTHQPIEQITAMRAMPNLHCWRPCDTTETAIAWQSAIAYQGPTALALSRQTLVHQKRDANTLKSIAKGGYILLEPETGIQAIIIATGSEVSLAIKVAEAANQQGQGVRVVSMPCIELFAEQPKSFQDKILPPSIRTRMAIEAGCTDSWYRWVGLDGKVLGIDRFGLSAPGDVAFESLKITFEQTQKVLYELLQQHTKTTR